MGSELGLGRLLIPDERDEAFPLRAVLPPVSALEEEDREAVERGWRYWWDDGWWGDQGGTSQCVAYAWLHAAEDGPITQAPYAPARLAARSPERGSAALDPGEVYNRAQRIDQWPGEDYDGTSVRAGAKVLQAEGVLSEYRWAASVEEVVDAILRVGPVIVGTWWYRAMFSPDEDGFLTIDGVRDGGHAYVLNGVNVGQERVRVKNSWGRSWGEEGRAWLRLSDLDRLLREGGEACLPVVRPSQ